MCLSLQGAAPAAPLYRKGIIAGRANIVSFDVLLKDPDKILAWLGAGDNIIMLHGGEFLAFILRVQEDDLDMPKKMISFKDLKKNEDDLFYFIKTGEEVVISFRSREVALITTKLPQDLSDFLED